MSIEKFYTETGDRPDLSSLQVNAPEGFIGNLVYPSVALMEKGGEITYTTVPDSKSAEEDRARGTAPSKNFITQSTDSYSMKQIEGRRSIAVQDVKNYGGIENADEIGGVNAKEIVLGNIEEDQADQLFTGSATNVGSTPLEAISDAVTDIKKYRGINALVLSYNAWTWLLNTDAVSNKLQDLGWRSVFGGVPADGNASWKEAIKAILKDTYGLGAVLVGDDEYWQTASGHAAVVKLPPADKLSHVKGPVLGKTLVHIPDGEDADSDGIMVTSHPDRDDKSNVYDAMMVGTVKEFSDNSGAKVLLDGFTDDESAT